MKNDAIRNRIKVLRRLIDTAEEEYDKSLKMQTGFNQLKAIRENIRKLRTELQNLVGKENSGKSFSSWIDPGD